MRAVRIVTTVIFAIVAVVFIYTFIEEKVTFDGTIPEITLDKSTIEVSYKATDEELLKGVTAKDGKDGDLTDRVIVESISNFIDKRTCKITYAVCDNDNHVATATRNIIYKDYISPRFKITGSTCFSLYDSIDVSSIISATDCMEGDLTRKMILTSPDYTKGSVGIYTIEASVTNNKGDTSEIAIPLYVEDKPSYAPEIKLKQYLVYIDRNSRFTPKDYLVSAADSEGVKLTQDVKIKSSVQTSREGMQEVHYYVTDARGVEGHTMLHVYVKGD